jgi:NADH-quinone oxidoreductase subunit E
VFRGQFCFSGAMNLKPETLRAIDEVIPHYPVKRSATLPLLHLIQEDVGYISPAAIEWVAAKLELQPINVFEVVTFYPMFRQQPIGRRHIKVCRTLSCALMGGYKTCAAFEQEFNTHRGEISPGGEVTIDFVECLASCGTAPVVLIDDDLHENVDVNKAKQLSAQIKAEAANALPPREAMSGKR